MEAGIYDIRKDLKILADELIDNYHNLSKEDREYLLHNLFELKNKIKKEIDYDQYNKTYDISEKQHKTLEDWKKIFEEAQYDKDFKIITHEQVKVDYVGDTVIYKIHGNKTEYRSRIEEVLNKIWGITDNSSKPLKSQDKISEFYTTRYHLTIKNATKLEEKFICELVDKLCSEKNFMKILLTQLKDFCTVGFVTDKTGWQNIIITVK